MAGWVTCHLGNGDEAHIQVSKEEPFLRRVQWTCYRRPIWTEDLGVSSATFQKRSSLFRVGEASKHLLANNG